MLRFLDGHLLGTVSHAGATAADANAGGGGGGNQAAAAAAAAAGANSAAVAANDAGKGAWTFPTDKPFAEYLPDAYRADPNFRDIKSFEDLAKGYVNAQKAIGIPKERRLELPGDNDNDPKAWDAVYNRLGRPEKVEGYQLPKPAEGKEYSDGDKAFQAQVLPVLHAAGVTQRQLAAIVPKWNEIQAAAAAAVDEKTKADIAAADQALTKEWGAAKPTKLGLASEAMGYLDRELKLDGALTKALERTDAAGNKLGNDPALAKLFAYFGEEMKEDGLIGKGGATQGAAEFSPAEAQQQINGLRSDKVFMKVYQNAKDPGHKDAVAKMQALYAQAYPPEKAEA